ncbi:exosortase/archaeosortase family protein [Pedobacter sp. SD-b]|uniref:Exosortase/archaeosortase family protein n=1 Tax=Pedobacter segetis TaxID=2793069 RepID=A0ABS1BGS0_9SPHI|nr:exosortase/archaeosortase family protein [Pedobacter segetis]MBK0382053.1 exosortase/archaeosortase family protein [Pedobacter segetis]
MKINKVQIRFFLILVLGYFFFSYFFRFWIGLCAQGGLYWQFANEHLDFIRAYRHFLIGGSTVICDIFGLRYLTNDTSLRIIGHGGIKIVYSCLGYGIISILMALSLAVPNQKVKDRVLFLVFSIIGFTLLNILRLFVVSYYAHYARKMQIDHHTLFNVFCYLLILIGIYWWIKKSAKMNELS